MYPALTYVCNFVIMPVCVFITLRMEFGKAIFAI